MNNIPLFFVYSGTTPNTKRPAHYIHAQNKENAAREYLKRETPMLENGKYYIWVQRTDISSIPERICIPYPKIEIMNKFKNSMKLIECAYCSTSLEMHQITRDHFIPKFLGKKAGKRRANIVYCCQQCNTLKADMHPNEFWLYLHHKLLISDDLKFEIMAINLERLLKEGIQGVRGRQIQIMEYNYRLINQEKQRTQRTICSASISIPLPSP
jgi:5-methylcytosine-specific restriction endonuclease McrA